MRSFGLRDLSAAGLVGAEVFDVLGASGVVDVSEGAEFLGLEEFLGFSELVDMGTSLLLGNEVRCT